MLTRIMGKRLTALLAFLALSALALGCGEGNSSPDSSGPSTNKQSSSPETAATATNAQDGDLRPGYTEEGVTCPVSLEDVNQIVGRSLEHIQGDTTGTSCTYVNQGGIHNNAEFTVGFEHSEGNVLNSYREADDALIGQVPRCKLDNDSYAGSEGYEGLCSGETPSAGMTFVTSEPERTWKVQLLYWAESENPESPSVLSQMLHELLFAEA